MPLPDDLLIAHLDRCLVSTNLPFGRRYSGKVRDTYRLDDGRIILITTDRISAFDHILPQPVPFKGQVLNGVAAHFFSKTEDLVPNHVLSIPDPNVTVARACDPFPIEFVVRGYLAGHAWRLYTKGVREICGVRLPEGLKEAERLPTPILTPSTKAVEGHDEDVTPQQIYVSGAMERDAFEEVASLAFSLFARGTALAAEQGLILVDTKYEFGRAPDGTITLIDEVHTPDSSRYYYSEGYEDLLRRGLPQRQLSKEFVREWLLAQGFSGLEGSPPNLPDGFRGDIAARYIELYETLTGSDFRPDTHPDPEHRILKKLEAVL